jgi:hypothetical protein
MALRVRDAAAGEGMPCEAGPDSRGARHPAMIARASTTVSPLAASDGDRLFALIDQLHVERPGFPLWRDADLPGGVAVGFET